VAAWFARAEATDAEVDRAGVTSQRGDEIPDCVVDKAQRLDRIRAAKARWKRRRARACPRLRSDGPMRREWTFSANGII
jgi:hypothetical protein